MKIRLKRRTVHRINSKMEALLILKKQALDMLQDFLIRTVRIKEPGLLEVVLEIMREICIKLLT